MKIAIKGHESRGKEVIQILESLGGKNICWLEGNSVHSYYYIDCNNNTICCYHEKYINKYYKKCTLEEFEKEFPFKVGDIVFHKGHKAIVEKFIPREHCYYIRYNNPPINGCYYTKWTTTLELKMKEERNITLTLDKAKEWYNKGGELKEVALQAYSEKELNPLPRSWEEFATNHARMGYYISADGKPLMCASSGKLSSPHVCPSQESAEAHLALIQLEQLRDCWRNGWKPTPNQSAFAIKFAIDGLSVYEYCSREFLSFKDRKTAIEFLKCFKDLIEKAGDLI